MNVKLPSLQQTDEGSNVVYAKSEKGYVWGY